MCFVVLNTGKTLLFFCRLKLIIERKKKNEVLAKINDIQPKIKEIYNYDKYCKDITKRAKGIQNNLNSFDKDIQKEKDNSRPVLLKLSFNYIFLTLLSPISLFIA